ncbi:glycosyltransferase family 1 protein [Elizabethkingia anophelis]|uniref:Glycosyl transferase family 1 n=1 Tax=Elizabethkingia anophelis TaxID=1117645 RepID=A0AAU8VCV5_9FLAO|nr:glycosyltransferase family 4 protein [Elizabethkingia anophelis]AQW94526.1 glycosyl transferase family 1 [Elizabethkingia anophelis]AQX00705.1 glycosyl transferase family 1 [Elizabethkingia anophelis]MCL1033039.1 glycosyltransferase family 4 protein [Elizabethkingia anophelis]MCW2462806.1 glycosyltransferase involved in cell wall biosynthesis [Elizabethkingia anophelis]MCW2466491.1 glycosyltransferase involved in cell wall biosynthesis [Elizabethkingia anophelis]
MDKIIRTSTVPESLFSLLKGQLNFLSNYYEVIGISSDNEFLSETAKREKVKVLAVNMERGISPFKDFVSLLKLYKQLKKEQPIIVHSITPKAGLLTMLAGKMAGVPIRMHTFTGLIFPTRTGIMQKLLIKMDQLLCWAATNIYPEGTGVKNDLINYKITSKPLKVLANGNVNGIDLEYFNPCEITDEQKNVLRHKFKIQATDFVFIFIGRLVGDKGINELIEAFSLIEIKNVKLLLIGPTEKDLDPLKEETIEKINSNPSIISVGFQHDVRPFLAIANVLTFPSYREGFPNTVIQAGAMGLPSIVTNINGCNEIILDGQNGTVIPVKDVLSLKNAMIEMISKIDYYSVLKEQCRSMIESRYKQSVVWNALLEEYVKLIEDNNTDI